MADTKSHTAPGSNGAEGEAVRDRSSSEIRTRGPLLFGKYELLQRVRHGGMAEVFRARDLAAPDRLLAIKRILPSFTDEADYVAMFIDEARLSLRLQHPAVARAIELGQVDDEFYLALEYISGLDVGAMLRRARARMEPLPVAIACRIAREVCSALEYAHDLHDERGEPLGIVHRDVSPQNVLVSFDGDVKLIDFGIAKSADQRMRTEAGLLKGKHGYLSPEQAQGQAVDRRSDLFSLGVCLYEMLSARRLFYGSSDFSTLGRVRRAEVPPLRDFNPVVSDELVAIVERALARRPDDRFQNAAELGTELDRFIEQSGLRCERAEVGEFVRLVAAETQQSVAESGEANAAADSTGLLDAFDDVEPVSAVSLLADAPPAALEPPYGGDPGGYAAPDMEPVTGADGVPAFGPGAGGIAPAVRGGAMSVGGIAPALRGGAMSIALPQPARGDATGEDLLEELSVDEPTRVGYDATANGVLAAPPATAPSPASPHATTLPGIGMEWDDEELSTQLYDPPEPGYGLPSPATGSLSRPRSAPPVAMPFAPSPSFPPAAGVSSPPATVGRPTPSGVRVSSSYPAPDSAVALGSRQQARGSSVGLMPRTGLAVWLIAGILALAAVGVPLALWLTRAPARGTMNLTAEPPDALVKLDGVPIGGHTSPFVLSNVEPDVGHDIEVSKTGYRTWSAHLTLAPGQVVQLPHVALAPEPAAAEPPASAAGPSAAPTAARAGRQPEQEPNAAAPASPAAAVDREPIEAPRAPAAAAARAAPPQAMPRPRPMAAGLGTARPRAAPVTGPATPATEPGKAAQPRADTAAAPAAAPKSAPAAAAEGTPGVLRINSRPWSQVFVDGRLVGNTPQMRITLGAGLHTVTLVNPDFGVQRVLSVQIKEGETVTKIVELSE